MLAAEAHHPHQAIAAAQPSMSASSRSSTGESTSEPGAAPAAEAAGEAGARAAGSAAAAAATTSRARTPPVLAPTGASASGIHLSSSAEGKQNIAFIISASSSASAAAPSAERPQKDGEPMASTTAAAAAATSNSPRPPTTEDLSTAASVLTSFTNSAPPQAAGGAPAGGMPVAYTPTTHRVSKAKKGKKVHVCEYGCGKVFSRAEHRRRHEANHRAEPLYRCPEVTCEKTFQRPDLLNRHLERQHNYRPGSHTTRQELEAAAATAAAHEMRPAAHMTGPPPGSAGPLEALRFPNSPTMNDFDAYGDEIRELYMRQKWPLKDIKAYMEDKHSFVPMDDHVYEQAFSRLCLQPHQPPHDHDTMRPPELDPLLIASSGLQAQPPHPTERSSEDNEVLQRLSRFADAAKAAKDGADDGKHDCPAPGCDHTGTNGFDTKDQLWGHIVAKHNMS